MVIWPLPKGPEQEFVPLYVHVSVIVDGSMCATPVAWAVHPAPIIELPGIVMVNVISFPDMVPVIVPGMCPCMPPKDIVPVTTVPDCDNCHVGAPIPAWPIIAPAPNVLLESDAVPDQVPATVDCDVWAVDVADVDGDTGVELLHPTVNTSTRPKTIDLIMPLQLNRRRAARNDTP
jgi:hypothetical protein